MASFRIGIDVGGTFTHAVALDAATFSLMGQAKVPTTHRAARGVAEGVVEALRLLLAEASLPGSPKGIAPASVTFLAYSTTQITNALLEGDVAPVGIVAIGRGLEGRRSQSETRLGDIELAPGRLLRTHHAYLERERLDPGAARVAVDELAGAGAQALVAAEAFSVDDPSGEQAVMAAAQAAGLPATGTHEISGRYGLRVRTRTAVVNASLLPKIIATAAMIEEAVRETGITSPLMVVRSDGGVMSIAEVRRRPLLTLLSGPAAGVAAALMYVRISDGVFVEVGGTSTDITAIQHGRALLRTAEVGGHRLFLRTLDVRTIGVAGGSMPRVQHGAIQDVGPRSAHLAGLAYVCFAEAPDGEGEKEGLRPVLFSPVAGDPDDYAGVETPGGRRLAVTLTCAANAAGRIPAGDWAHGDEGAARRGLAALGGLLRQSAEGAAESVLDVAARKAAATVQQLLSDRSMSRETTELVAGGGGASALAPAVGALMGLPVRVAPNAVLVSAIGTALALVRETVERTVPDATEDDLLRIRREAAEAVVRAGADPDSVAVDIEYDAQTAVLRAIATGQTELRERDLSQLLATDEERRAAAAKSLRVAPEQVEQVADSGLLRAYRGAQEPFGRPQGRLRRLFGLVSQRREGIALVDQQGVIRLLLPGGSVAAVPSASLRAGIAQILDRHTRYGDAGAELPQVLLGVRGKIVNLSGMANAGQVLALAEAEMAALSPEETILVAVAPRSG
jgi:N-methylhydantoinase A/oxoprolinase/acetone carboxylase beta subunit